MNIPVPNNAKTINGTKLKDGNDQIASKNFTPKNTNPPVFLLILYVFHLSRLLIVLVTFFDYLTLGMLEHVK